MINTAPVCLFSTTRRKTAASLATWENAFKSTFSVLYIGVSQRFCTVAFVRVGASK